MPRGIKGLNLVGERFDKLLVIAFIESTPSGKLWLCRCNCGQEIVKMTTQLRRINFLHSGCRSCESISRSASQIEHGGCEFGKSKLYMIWKEMRGRCNRKNNPYYGGKGILVCPEWQSFEKFREWALSHGYSEGLSIDRRDSNYHYQPSNCRWLTRSENSRLAGLSRK